VILHEENEFQNIDFFLQAASVQVDKVIKYVHSSRKLSMILTYFNSQTTESKSSQKQTISAPLSVGEHYSPSKRDSGLVNKVANSFPF